VRKLSANETKPVETGNRTSTLCGSWAQPNNGNYKVWKELGDFWHQINW